MQVLIIACVLDRAGWLRCECKDRVQQQCSEGCRRVREAKASGGERAGQRPEIVGEAFCSTIPGMQRARDDYAAGRGDGGGWDWTLRRGDSRWPGGGRRRRSRKKMSESRRAR